MFNKNQLHTKGWRSANDQKHSIIPSPVRKNILNSRVKFSPISKTSQSSSKIMDRDIKKIESVIYQKKQPTIPSNLKISKELTITHVNDTENNIISKLKKLPDITINLVKSEPVFKVPESPKPKTNKDTKNITSQNKFKKRLSVRGNDNIIVKDNLLFHNDINILNTNLNSSSTLKQKPKQTSIISLITKSSGKKMSKNPKVIFKKYPVWEKENLQITTSPKIKSSSKIESNSSKTMQRIEETSKNSSSKEIKTISDKDTIINNIQLKTNKHDSRKYRLMDLSTDGEISIVPAYFPLDFINDSVPEYDNFLLGISKSSKDNSSLLKTTQKDTEKESIANKKESYNFSDFIDCINTSLNINESDDIHSKLESQSINDGNSLDNIKDNQLCIINKSKENMIGKFEDEQNQNSNFNFYNHTSKQPSLKHNHKKKMTQVTILQEDSQLLEKIASYNCDIPIENMPKNENGTKRKHSKNDLSMCEKLKKQKIKDTLCFN